MNKRDMTSAIVDGILKTLIISGSITSVVVLPNIAQVIDKPVSRYLNKMDKRSRQRELSRITSYMKNRGLVSGDPENYKHGIKITTKGKRRINSSEFENLEIKKPKIWDKKWRLILFDIPESKKRERNLLRKKLLSLNFISLQKSAWVHPYPCRNQLETITATYNVNRYVSYLELSKIDNEKQLRKRFDKQK